MTTNALPSQAPSARYTAIILACAATALLIVMGLTVVRALRTTRIDTPDSTPTKRSAIPASSLDPSLRTLASEHFTIAFSSRIDKTDAVAVETILETARTDMARRLNAAQLSIDAVPHLEIVLHESTGDFTSVTGLPWWAGAATKGHRIELQPLEVLRNRRILESTLSHEYTHAVIEALGHGKTARWLAEGLALMIAGEGPHLGPFMPKKPWTNDDIDHRLEALASPNATLEDRREAYASAYRITRSLIKEKTEASIWKMIASSEYSTQE